MKNIKKWIIGGLIIGIISGVSVSFIIKDNTVDTNAINCMSDNVIIEDDYINHIEEEYTMDIVYTTDWLNVRDYPSLDSNILDVISPNTAITRVAKLHNGWSKVIYNDETKYMHSDYLSETEISNSNNNETDTDIQTIDDDNDADCSIDIDNCFEDTYIEENYDYVNSYDDYNYTDNTSYCNADYTADEFQELGIISWGMYRYTWYSELVLSGEGLEIEGRYVDENGFVCDIDNYICVASDSLDRGTIVDTPFGKQGKVYDCGCGSDDIIDCYVSW